MNDLQRKTAKAIVNIFETGRVAGDYGAVTVLKGDTGHLTYGRSQTTLGSGNLFLLISAYCQRPDAQFATELRPFLNDLQARNVDLDNHLVLRETLRSAGDDPAMRAEQNRFFDEHYLDPACRAAQAKGVTSALGQTVVYDSFIQGGFSKVAPTVAASIGVNGVTEQQWVQQYIAARKQWLSGLQAPLPRTVYRMDSFADLIQANAWELPFSPTLTVHGVTFSAQDVQDDPLPIVRATAVNPSDPPAPRLLLLTSPYMQGDDVVAVQQALNANGFANDRDGIFGPFTQSLVKKFQSAHQITPDGILGPLTRSVLGL